jgi:RNA polymerase sigma-70 factor (ECF subfamily)
MTSTTQDISRQLDSLVSSLFDDSIHSQDTLTQTSDDSHIVKSIVRGCRDNYSLLVSKYYSAIYNYIYRSVNFHVETAQDLLSETFFKAYLNLNRFRSGTKFSSWLYRIAHNLIIDHYRSYKKEQSQELDTISDNQSSYEIAQKLTQDALNSPIKSSEVISPILNSLSEDDRQLLMLFYLEELSVQEIASIYNVFPGTIKTRLHRARKKARATVTNHTDTSKDTFVERIESFLHNFQTVFANQNK